MLLGMTILEFLSKHSEGLLILILLLALACVAYGNSK
jgi:hypothetical protein